MHECAINIKQAQESYKNSVEEALTLYVSNWRGAKKIDTVLGVVQQEFMDIANNMVNNSSATDETIELVETQKDGTKRLECPVQSCGTVTFKLSTFKLSHVSII